MTRLSERTLVVLAVVGAVLLASILIVASLAGGTESTPAAPQPEAAPAAAAPEHDSLLHGIPQDGIALGDSKAPVTLVEYADLQCHYCAAWARDAFPAVVDEYVRKGKVRIVFRGLAFLGPDSETALRAALAAGEQDRLWHVVHGLFVSQGAENAGWVTDGLLRSLGRGANVDADRMLAESYSPAVERELGAARAAADRVGVPGTPFFQAGPTGGVLKPLRVQALDADTFRAELDRLLQA
jgi:protein-disulfide isomerase